MDMTEVHLICGKVGAGKSTYATTLARANRALVLSLDEWTIELYDHPPTRELFDDHVARCSELMVRLAERLVKLGTEVVLDFGFWKQDFRETVRRRIERAGGRPVLHYLDVAPEERWKRLQARNHDRKDHAYVLSRAEFDEFEGKFESPTEEEEPLSADLNV